MYLRDGHFDGATARHDARVEDDVAHNAHGVLQVAVDLIQYLCG
jgi:hypothetical protein